MGDGTATAIGAILIPIRLRRVSTNSTERREGKMSLNATERAVCRQFGLNEADFVVQRAKNRVESSTHARRVGKSLGEEQVQDRFSEMAEDPEFAGSDVDGLLSEAKDSIERFESGEHDSSLLAHAAAVLTLALDKTIPASQINREA
jgi:hypothetical protein